MAEYNNKSKDLKYYKWNEREYKKYKETVKEKSYSIEKYSINNETSTPNKNNYDNLKVKSNETNSFAELINKHYKGVPITIYTKSSQKISGEVIYYYDNIIVLKTENQTYCINPKAVIYFC